MIIFNQQINNMNQVGHGQIKMKQLQRSSILSKMQSNFKNLPERCGYIRQAVNFLRQIIRESHESIFISFNGGKDATIVLTLTYLALVNCESVVNSCGKQFQGSGLPRGLYFEEPNPFPEMVEFYEQMKQVFDLEMMTLSSKKYAQELTKLSKNVNLSGVIMGSRNGDPYCEHLDLVTQSDTSKGYPLFKRINPIIRWNYEQVWEAIKLLEIPYCVLYQQGYTSIGNMNNTVKNPTLFCGQNKHISPFQAKPQSERICRVSDKN